FFQQQRLISLYNTPNNGIINLLTAFKAVLEEIMDKSHHIEHIVIDLEFNQSYNTKKGDKSETVAECPFEIIQIGAVKLDENLDIKDQFTVLIKPQIYPKINPIVERITGITDEILDSCVNFEEAFRLFAKFAG